MKTLFLKVIVVAIAMGLSGCSAMQRFANSMNWSVGGGSSYEEMPMCPSSGIGSFDTFYIDTSQTYYQDGQAIVYGKDGKKCKLTLRYQ